MTATVPVECRVHFPRRGRAGARVAVPGPPPALPPGRIPRTARLMALAIRLEAGVRAGEGSYAELARRGGVTRARVTQVMGLLHLAPDLQEAVLALPRVTAGRDPLTVRHLLPITSCLGWGEQRRRWNALLVRTRG